jgi:hypothetical protein
MIIITNFFIVPEMNQIKKKRLFLLGKQIFPC